MPRLLPGSEPITGADCQARVAAAGAPGQYAVSRGSLAGSRKQPQICKHPTDNPIGIGWEVIANKPVPFGDQHRFRRFEVGAQCLGEGRCHVTGAWSGCPVESIRQGGATGVIVQGLEKSMPEPGIGSQIDQAHRLPLTHLRRSGVLGDFVCERDLATGEKGQLPGLRRHTAPGSAGA